MGIFISHSLIHSLIHLLTHTLTLNTLDLVITRNSQNKIHKCRTQNYRPIIIIIVLNLIKPKQIIKYITYRKLNNIDTLEYSNDF